MVPTRALPFPQTYWVVPGLLLAGLYPGSLIPQEANQKIRALVDCGIRRVINLMEANEVNSQGQSFVPYLEPMRALAATTIAWSRYPIPDGGIPHRETMCQILDEIDSSITAGLPVYIHCWGGKGRTGTVIGCYLARHQIAVGSDALKRIVELRRHILPYQASPENELQRAMVCSWQPGD